MARIEVEREERDMRGRTIILGLALLAVIAVAIPAGAAGGSASARTHPTKSLWHASGISAAPRAAKPAVRPRHFRSYSLNKAGMKAVLAQAPRERTRAARTRPLVISLPTPSGGFQRFRLVESPVMQAGLARRHPNIKTYSGEGLDDKTATIRADLTPLGFHASVRSAGGSWYIDPYFRLDQSVYVSYFARDATNTNGVFVERDGGGSEISADQPNYRPDETVTIQGSGFEPGAPVTLTISDPAGNFAERSVEASADDAGSFSASFVADPDGNLDTHLVEASDGTDGAATSYQVVSADDASVDPPVGDQLRTYRLALLSDPSYATFFGGSANVTAAKVTLMNRVDQIYEDETSIRLVLVANNDLVNLDTAAQATGANGPCGTAACFTAAQLASCGSGTLSRNRIVIGQLIGASNYDVGHLALGVNGGGIASLGVVGRSAKAQGCTGLPAPTGDFYAVDYVAHEMGHQFSGNHPFNGTNSNCSGGNRNAATSVEPGSGSSIMAYAGICAADDIQPHSDPYWSQRSFQEITTYIASNQAAINEVQTISLRSFDTNGDSFRLNYNGNDSVAIVRGTNYTAAGILAAIQGIAGWPGGTVAVANFGGGGTPSDNGFQLTFNNGPLAGTNVNQFSLTNFNLADGFVGETDKGGPVDNKGFTITPTGNGFPVVNAGAAYTIPLRTPFALTGSATDPNGDTLTYMWEQNDRGGATGTALQNNAKANGPLFRQFGTPLRQPPYVPSQYNSPGANAVTTDPTRVFPDLPQIIANNTNAETGTCPAGNIDCFSEFLPTAAYVGFAGTNASPARLNFRFTARDGHAGGGGVASADTVLTLATNAGPFLVTAPNTAATFKGGSSQSVTWSVANTNIAPTNAANVKISLSTDGGFTYPFVLAASTANDGSEAVTLPNIGTTQGRVKIEAVGNVFFDISNADFAIQAVPVVTNDAPGGTASVQYSDALSPTVTISASDPDSYGSDLTAAASGLPAGLSLAEGSVSGSSTLPGTHTWTVAGNVTDAPGSYPVTVTVTDEAGGTGSTSFTIVVTKEDADATYTGDMLAFTASGGSSANALLRATVRDSAVIPLSGDSAPGDIRNATVTFKEGATTLCGPLPVSLINGALTTGTASCTKSLAIGDHTIDIYVNGYYTGTGTGVVEIAEPNGSFITGGGYRILSASAGTYAADPGSKSNFGFNVKYKNAKATQGHLNLIFRRGGRTYQVKSTAIESLGIALKTGGGGACAGPPSATCFGVADFRSKANLSDVTDPLASVSIAGGLTLQVTLTDKGEPGKADTIGFTVWDGAQLVFSSQWSGAKTLEGLLEGGNTVVH